MRGFQMPWKEQTKPIKLTAAFWTNGVLPEDCWQDELPEASKADEVVLGFVVVFLSVSSSTSESKVSINAESRSRSSSSAIARNQLIRLT